jgi:plasmid stabilization system protein ParE
MKTRRIIYSNRFRYRLEAIAEYIFEKSRSKQTTSAHITSIRSSLQILKTYPLLGRVADEFGESIRKIVIFDYTILYCINDEADMVEILNIFRENLP